SPSRLAGARNEIPIPKDVQVFADHAAVVENTPVIGDQSRNLAQRFVRNDILVTIDRMRGGGHELDPVAQAELGCDDETLAHERRGGSVVELQVLLLRVPREAAADG